MNTEMICTRRGFVKVAAGAVAAAAMFAAGAESIDFSKAFASEALADGTYKVNANLYISKDDSPIGSAAYLCNLKNPVKLQGRPTTPVTGTNATLVVENGSGTLTFGTLNECIAWIKCEDERVTVIDTVAATYKTKGDPATRIDKVSINLGGLPETLQLTNCTEFAGLPIYWGYKYWDIYLDVDYSTAVSA